MDAHRRAVANDRQEVVARTGLLLAPHAAEAEVAVGLAKLAKSPQVANHKKHRLAIEHLLIEPPLHLHGQRLKRCRNAQPPGQLDLMGQMVGEFCQHDLGLFLGDCRLEHHKPGRPPKPAARMRIMLGGQAHDRDREQARAEVLPLANDQHVGPPLPAKDRRGGILDRDRVSQPGQWCEQFVAGDGALFEHL